MCVCVSSPNLLLLLHSLLPRQEYLDYIVDRGYQLLTVGEYGAVLRRCVATLPCSAEKKKC